MSGRRLLLGHALLPGAAFVAMAVPFATTDLDRTIARAWAFDSALRAFPARNAWWASDLLHGGGWYLVLILGLTAVGTWLASFFCAAWREYRRPALFVFVAIGVAILSVDILRELTNVDCPWDLAGFGGTRPYVSLFGNRPDSLPRATCFPGAHSSSGFALMAFYFALRERHGTAAVCALLLAIGIGAVFGIGQEARGAHFISHDLWSAFVVWFVELALYLRVFRGRLWPAAAS
jgi:membrane-associated PAP2 superfamily phosphatase